MIVLNSSGPGGIHSYSSLNTYYSKLNRGSITNTTMNPNYDSSSFTALTDSHSRFQMDMVSRLSQEVRAATTTGRVQELRQAVMSGNYHPDATEIAKRLLFLVEG